MEHAGCKNGDDLELSRRRAAYRASHRGTKELDWLLGRYAAARLAGLSREELAAFERLLGQPDPDLYDWILYPETLALKEFAALIRDIRRFHQLEPAPAGEA